MHNPYLTLPLQAQSDGHWFLDQYGRRVLLRGVNLGGSTKVPTIPDGRPHLATDFLDHRMVSFVGRPFSLADADVHLMRLRHWGFNCLRFLTTWEAIEHAAPGEYDEAYLDYLYQVVKKAGEYDFAVFVDPHQDAWSRMSGGDGAPGWTLELVGFDISKLDASEAAITMQARYPDNYPAMGWPNNWGRLASATMFTLFFAGERFAPQLQVAGESIQHYLQRHFIGAMEQVALRLRDLPHVIGYDSLNEPSRGYLGIHSLSAPLPVFGNAPQLSAFQSMIVAAGFPIEVPLMARRGAEMVATSSVTLNPARISAWREPSLDVWRNAGVWEVDAKGQAQLLADDYFADFDFFADGVRPFARRYMNALRKIHPDTFLFIESDPIASETLTWENAPAERIVNASHWYDALTLISKQYNPALALQLGKEARFVTGVEAVNQLFETQIAHIVANSQQELQGVPTLIGEFGVPFDLNDGRSYATEDFSAQTNALSSYYDALDANLAHSTLWNYTPDNTNQWGDGWNGEDLSIFSRSQQWNPYDLDNGGRAIEGFCRPTIRACTGIPTRQRFHRSSGDYELHITAEANRAPTELYVPRIQYREGYRVTVSDGQIRHDLRNQKVYWFGMEAGEQWLKIERAT